MAPPLLEPGPSPDLVVLLADMSLALPQTYSFPETGYLLVCPPNSAARSRIARGSPTEWVLNSTSDLSPLSRSDIKIWRATQWHLYKWVYILLGPIDLLLSLKVNKGKKKWMVSWDQEIWRLWRWRPGGGGYGQRKDNPFSDNGETKMLFWVKIWERGSLVRPSGALCSGPGPRVFAGQVKQVLLAGFLKQGRCPLFSDTT